MKSYPDFSLLIVDDHQHNLFSLRSLIRQHLELEIMEADSGQRALELALERQPDLILLDVQMPEMDGFQTASMLKIRKRTRDIPVIFLTAAFKSREFQQRGYDVGAVDYLLKPIDDNLLINKISTYFRLIEKERNLNRLLEQQVAERTAQLAEAKQRMENIVRFMGEALLLLSPDGRVTLANPAASRMLGYSQEQLLGMAIGDLFEEQEDEQADAFMGTWLEAIIRVGALEQVEARFINAQGERIPILFSRSAILNEQGQPNSIICIAKDMTGYIREPENRDPGAARSTP